eukprot:1390268-Amphidinium_carterae.2
MSCQDCNFRRMSSAQQQGNMKMACFSIEVACAFEQLQIARGAYFILENPSGALTWTCVAQLHAAPAVQTSVF